MVNIIYLFLKNFIVYNHMEDFLIFTCTQKKNKRYVLLSKHINNQKEIKLT